jgi:PAS domain S-box-containing protein
MNFSNETVGTNHKFFTKDALLVIDKDYNVIQVNEYFCTLSGGNSQLFIGEKCHEVFHCSLCHTSDCPMPQILTGKKRQVNYYVEMKHVNGYVIPCILTAEALTGDDNNVIGIIEYFKDIRKINFLEINNHLSDRHSNKVLNMALCTEISKRQEYEFSLKRKDDQIRLISSQLQQRNESERKKIANDLHDVLGSSLTSIKYSLTSIINCKEKISKDVLLRLESLNQLIQNAMQEVREISLNLRPSLIDDLGIISTISWLCTKFEKTYPRVFVDQQITISEKEIPEPLKIVIFRILQEAMNNIARHCQCDTVRIILKKNGGSIYLIIEDTGNGFDLNEQLSIKSDHENPKMGLISMKERARLSGGKFSIQSKIGAGTRIKVTWSK